MPASDPRAVLERVIVPFVGGASGRTEQRLLRYRGIFDRYAASAWTPTGTAVYQCAALARIMYPRTL